MDVPKLPDGLPQWVQILFYGLLFAGAGVVMAWRFFSKLAEPPEPTKHVVLEQAMLADMSPFRRMANDMKEMSGDTAAIRRLLEEQAAEKEDDARIQAIIDKVLEKRTPPRVRRRKVTKKPNPT
jgi:hypothetical protein